MVRTRVGVFAQAKTTASDIEEMCEADGLAVTPGQEVTVGSHRLQKVIKRRVLFNRYSFWLDHPASHAMF